MRISPSAAPLTKGTRAVRLTAVAVTPSRWPVPSDPNRGLANIRSILAAVTARVYSRARAMGWWSGSRLRCCLRRSPEFCRSVEAAERLKALTLTMIL